MFLSATPIPLSNPNYHHQRVPIYQENSAAVRVGTLSRESVDALKIIDGIKHCMASALDGIVLAK